MSQEFLLDTDQYHQPKVLSNKDAIAAKLLLLLNMVPGTNPMHLEMGVDMSGRYRFCGEGDVEDLEIEIQHQIETYLPDYASIIQVNCQFNNEGLIETVIRIDDTLYNFETGEKGTTFSLDDIGYAGAEDDEGIPDDNEDYDLEDLPDDPDMQLDSIDEMEAEMEYPFVAEEGAYGELPPGSDEFEPVGEEGEY